MLTRMSLPIVKQQKLHVLGVHMCNRSALVLFGQEAGENLMSREEEDAYITGKQAV